MFIEQLEDVGEGRYQVFDALRYTILMIPQLLIDLTSFAGLIGATIGLGVLAKNSELIAMQSIGISQKHIAKIIFFFGLIIMVLILLVSQFIIPNTTRSANVGKILATSNSKDLLSGTGFWAQEKGVFLHVEDAVLGDTPRNVEIFTFDDKRTLTKYMHAKEADIQPDGSWVLKNVIIREYQGDDVAISNKDKMTWQSFLGSSQTAIINSAQQSLSITDLYKYFTSLKKRGESYTHQELLFWQKLSAPIVTISMMLIGIIFMFGSLRNTTISTRVALAILLSVLFYLLNQIAIHSGTLLQLPAAVIVSIPLLVITAVAFMMLQLNS